MNVEMQPEVKLSPLRLITRFVPLALCSKRGPIVERMRVDQAFFFICGLFCLWGPFTCLARCWPHERTFCLDENWNYQCTLEIPVKDSVSYWVTADLFSKSVPWFSSVLCSGLSCSVVTQGLGDLLYKFLDKSLVRKKPTWKTLKAPSANMNIFNVFSNNLPEFLCNDENPF